MEWIVMWVMVFKTFLFDVFTVPDVDDVFNLFDTNTTGIVQSMPLYVINAQPDINPKWNIS